LHKEFSERKKGKDIPDRVESLFPPLQQQIRLLINPLAGADGHDLDDILFHGVDYPGPSQSKAPQSRELVLQRLSLAGSAMINFRVAVIFFFQHARRLSFAATGYN
jgi:hypothetical protein